MCALYNHRIGPTWSAVCQRLLLVAGLMLIASPASSADEDTDSAASAVAVASDDASPVQIQITVDEQDASIEAPDTEAAAEQAAREAEAEAERAHRIALATPTHHQTGLIPANASGLTAARMTCFCLAPDGRLLVGCAGSEGEIRVFDGDGNHLESLSTPVSPEAIGVRADGVIFLAGEGQLAKLSPTGEVDLLVEAPHAAAVNERRDEIRKEVIAQAEEQAKMFERQTDMYDEAIAESDRQIAGLQERLADLEKAAAEAAAAEGDEQSADADAGKRWTGHRDTAGVKRSIELQITMLEQRKKQLEAAKQQWAQMIEQRAPQEMTDDEIDNMVESSIAYKLKASSISATEDTVFLASRSAVGYGFEVWKMSDRFEDSESIIANLSGCCGQMDVKVNDDGVFVAENSRHRVCRFDRDGELICRWGKGARTGLVGFGGCCNPMNVAFGPDGTVYTAETDTGRIKRYSPDGELLGLVGASDLKPGCVNVSISVSADGNRVYMLDINRNHIVRLEPYAPGEAPGPVAFEESLDDTASGTSQGGSSGFARAVAEVLSAMFGGGD